MPDDAGIRQDHAAAELVINALDKRHGKTAVIHHSHPDRITRAFAAAPRCGLVIIDLVGEGGEGGRFQQTLDIGFQLARVGDMGIAQTKRQFGGLYNAVNGGRFVSIGHGQAVGYPEDRQRHQPLRWRRKVPHFALLML